MNTQLVLFDYNQLDSETRIVVQQRTSEIKALMKRTAQDIIEIGEKLGEVRDRLEHNKQGGFSGWLKAEFDWTYRTALNFIRVSERFNSENFSELDFAPSALYLLAAPSTPDEARQEAIDRAQGGQAITYTTARQIVTEHRQSEQSKPPVDNRPLFADDPDLDAALDDESKPVCPNCGQVYDGASCPDCRNEQQPANKMSVHYSSETPEWYTPSEIIERVVKLFGEIDLDPCSNPGEPNIPAKQHYTQDDNGLSVDWFGRVYMNPPYGREIEDWVRHLCQQWESENVTEAIALVPARTDTKWFRRFEPFLRCFIYGRLSFSGHDDKAPFPSMAVYLGRNESLFKSVFSDIGGVYRIEK